MVSVIFKVKTNDAEFIFNTEENRSPKYTVKENYCFDISAIFSVDVSGVLLHFGDVSLELDENSEREFFATPTKKRNSNRDSPLFENYFGQCRLSISYIYEGQECFDELGFFDVECEKGAKALKDIPAMIRYVYKQANQYGRYVNNVLSPVEFKINADSDTTSISKQIEFISSCIAVLRYSINNLRAKPIVRVDVYRDVQPYSEDVFIDDGSISWIYSNLDTLVAINDTATSALEIDGRSYLPTFIEVPRLHESTDVYENQVIHGFCLNLLKSLDVILKEYPAKENAYTNKYNNAKEGYVSLYEMVSDVINKSNSSLRDSVNRAKSALCMIMAELDLCIPVSNKDSSYPLFTIKAQHSEHYRPIFNKMFEWFKRPNITPEKNEFLLSIPDISKLYEYYCYFRLLDIKNEHIDEFISEFSSDIYIDLRVEPEYWAYRHTKSEGDIFRVGHKDYKVANSYSSISKRKFAYNLKYNPDFVFEIRHLKSKEIICVMILDAKFSTSKTAFDFYLKDCIVKYIHGVGSLVTKKLTSALILLCPSIDTDSKYIDFHDHDFSLNGSHTLFPIIGVQEIALDRSRSSDFLKETLMSMIEKTVRNIEFL